MRISQIIVYPIKSGPGVECETRKTTERGFEFDRRFVVVDEDYHFRSQRKDPVLGRTKIHQGPDGVLTIEAPGRFAFHVGPPLKAKPVEVTIWDDKVMGMDAGEAAAMWFSEVVGETSHLIWMPDSSRRPVDQADGVALSFADSHPFLLTSTASLNDLNQRIDGPPIAMEAFRPGMVVEGADAWAEDSWKVIQIGEAVFDVVEDCTRCSITMLDPESPDRPRDDGEPLKTLATFRKSEGGVTFGRYLVCREPGKHISIHDEIVVLETT